MAVIAHPLANTISLRELKAHSVPKKQAEGTASQPTNITGVTCMRRKNDVGLLGMRGPESSSV